MKGGDNGFIVDNLVKFCKLKLRRKSKMNKWTGMGRLVSDPEVTFTASGKCFARFTLAINYRVNGEDHAEFVRCKCWEKTAEYLGAYYGKGDKLLVTGHLQTNKFVQEDKTYFDHSVVIERIECAAKLNKNTQKMPNEQPLPKENGAVEAWPPIDQEEIFRSEDIPF